jgi:hypothetical protein
MGKISLHVNLLFLCFALNGIELNSLSFDVCEAGVLGLQGVNVHNDAGIAEVKQRIIYDIMVRDLNVRLARVSMASTSECTRGDPLVLAMTCQRVGVEVEGGRGF